MEIESFRDARDRIAPHVRVTPILPAPGLGRRVWLKLESQQVTGSFKARPAYNSILSALEEARNVGVVCSSSGNFAIAVAHAARELGVTARIVMMSSASKYKRRKTEALGAEVILSGDTLQERLETLERVKTETGSVALHQYDSPESIAGDATIGLELLEQLPGDFTLIVPVSGGGLLSGVASAVKRLRPGCEVLGVLPQSHHWKLRRFGGEPPPRKGITIADALVPAYPGKLTEPLARRHADELIETDDGEILKALGFLVDEQKIIAEPGAAVSLVPLLAKKARPRHADVVCLITGGNVTVSRLHKLLTET